MSKQDGLLAYTNGTLTDVDFCMEESPDKQPRITRSELDTLTETICNVLSKQREQAMMQCGLLLQYIATIEQQLAALGRPVNKDSKKE